jgi:dCTP deaminase
MLRTEVHLKTYTAYLVSALIERILRLERFIQDVSPANRARGGMEATDSLVSAFLDSIKERKHQIYRTARRLNAIPQDDFDINNATSFREFCKVGFRFFKSIHEEFRRLPSPEVERETYLFLANADPRFLEFKSTVVLDHLYSVYLYTSDKMTAANELPFLKRVPVFTLPKVERDNPLFWPLVMHELGHERAERDSSFAPMLREEFDAKVSEPRARELVTPWAKEFYADVVAALILGPAYLCSFGNIAMPFSLRALRDPDDGHPSPAIRMEMLIETLQQVGYNERFWQSTPFGGFLELFDMQGNLDRHLHEADVDEYAMEDDWMSSDLARDLGRLVRKHVIARFSVADSAYLPEDCRRALQMTHQLESGMPVSAYRPIALQEAFPNGGFEDVDAGIYLGQLKELPCKAGDIVTAGWAHRIKTFEKQLFSALDSIDEKSCFSAYGEYVFRLDALLEKSLETANVHEFYLEPLDELQSHQEHPEALLLSRAGTEMEPDSLALPSGMLGRTEIMHRLSTEYDGQRIVVTPLIDPQHQIGACTIDLRLGTEFIIKEPVDQVLVDPVASLRFAEEKQTERVDKDRILKRVDPATDTFILHPGDFVLASTLEYVKLPADLLGMLEGRSTWARQGLGVHSTASFIQPGSEGVITFELKNTGSIPIVLYVGMRVAQLAFFQLPRSEMSYAQSAMAKYNRHYHTMPALYWKDEEFALIRKKLDDAERAKCEEVKDEGEIHHPELFESAGE